MIPLQYLLACAGCFSTLQTGLNFAWPSYALPQLLRNDSTIPLTNDQGSWVASNFLMGITFSSIITGLTLDVFGRRTMLLVISFPLFGTWLLIAYSQAPWHLYLARFIAGISDGVFFSCFPLYLAEVCEPKVRGFLITGTVITLFSGMLLGNLLGAFFSITQAAVTSAILSLLPFLLYWLIPESPYFYVIRKKFDQAKISTEKFKGEDNVDVFLSLIRNTLTEQKANKKKLRQLFSDVYNLKSLSLMIMLGFFHQFSGFLGITFYIETLFEKAKGDVNPIVFISAYYMLQISLSFLNAILIDKVGRRPLLLTSFFLITVGLFFVTVYFGLKNFEQTNVSQYSWLPVLGLFVYVIGYTIGLENVPVILSGEIFSLDFKAYANSISNFSFGLMGTGLSKFFQYTKDEFGMFVPFLTFTVVSTGGLAFIYFFLPETKRKTLEEIQMMLKSKTALSTSTN